MKAEEYRGTFGAYLAPRKNEHGLAAMFRRGAGEPYPIHETRLPLIREHLQKVLSRDALPCERLAQEDSKLTLVEIERAIEEVKAFKPS
jgi:hypothetical protein